MVDMAVGIVIGGAFATVVKSIVDNVFMPVLGGITSKVNFSNLYWNLNGDYSKSFSDAKNAGEPVVGYGQFIQDLISFLILSFVVFLVIKKVIGSMQKEEDEAPSEPPAQEVLLTEIRDLLKKDS